MCDDPMSADVQRCPDDAVGVDAVVAVDRVEVAYLAELDELNERYRRIGAGSPGARRMALFFAPYPVDPPR